MPLPPASSSVTDPATGRPHRPRLPLAVRPWLGGALISFSGVWVRLADVEPTRSALLRGAYALPVLLLLLVRDRRRTRRSGPPGSRPRWLLPLGVLAGAFIGLDLIAWHASMAILGAGLGTVFPNLQVVFVALAGVVLFGERPGRGLWVALPIVLAGVVVLGAVGRPVEPDGPVALGVAYGVLTGVVYAIALVIVRVARRRTPEGNGVVVLFSLTVGLTLVTGTVAAVQGVLGPAGWPADGWLLLLALGSQVVGWLLLTSSIAALPAALTSVALLLQPVLGRVWGRVLLGEPVGPAQVGGATLLLVGIALAQRAAASAATTTPPAG